MKKSLIAIAAVIIMGTSGLALAQMDKGKEMMGDKGMMGMMGDKGMGMCPMMGGMMSSMMGKSMVGTSDGGVIVLAGNKLVKYDKDLNVVKEVEVKMDMEGMQKNMMDMMKNCPMMKGVGGMNKSEKAQDTKAAAPSDEVDHAAHH